MITLLSPAKTLDFEHAQLGESDPTFIEDAIKINAVLRKKSANSLMSLMKISEKLAKENKGRNVAFSEEFNAENSRSAIFAFKGDVYKGFEAETLKKSDLNFANKHVRILSGLYGLLKPYDKIQAYRLEMGTNLTVNRKKNLYAYWGEKLADHLMDELSKHKSKVILNLASNEYFKAVDHPALKALVISANFKEYRNDQLKFISFNAKKARGIMTKFIVQNRIDKIEDLKGFNVDGYAFDESNSDERNLLFTR